MSDDKEDKDNDYEFARETLYDMICKGRDGVEEMLEVAKASEHPRAYEVLAKLMKDTADVSGQLMNLHQQKKNIEREDKPKQGALPAGDTNVFIGSTTDLQRMLKDINEKEVSQADYDTIEDSRHDEE
jgi:hypothetical protein|tara:strand:+ start:552 stop:935 length:384 start_codon:yes stop_codon:yes gene_type:complete